MVKVAFRDLRRNPVAYPKVARWDLLQGMYRILADDGTIVAAHPEAVVHGISIEPEPANTKTATNTLTGAKGAPGEFDCYADVPDDEPIFVLRARDPLAPVMIQLWTAARSLYRIPDDRECNKQVHAIQIAEAMRKYRHDNFSNDVVREPYGPAAALLAAFESMAHAACSRGASPIPDRACDTTPADSHRHDLRADVGVEHRGGEAAAAPDLFLTEIEVVDVTPIEGDPCMAWVEAVAVTPGAGGRFKLVVPKRVVLQPHKRYRLNIQRAD